MTSKLATFFQIYGIITSIIGTFFIIFAIVTLIKFINLQRLQKQSNKEIFSKIEKSNFLNETFQPITKDEVIELRKNGTVETKLEMDLNTMDLTKIGKDK